ncbi:MAG: hypothetical protein R2708_09620 [Vicinamibacterales bacterium]
MSLDERLRTVLADALTEVRTRLETEFAASLTDARAEFEREKAAALTAADEAAAAALAETRTRLQGELQAAFEADKTALAAAHEQLLAQAADAARLELTRVTETSTADLERLRAEAEAAQARLRADADATVEALRAELREAQAAALQSREASDSQVTTLQSAHEAELAQAREEVSRLREQVEALSRERDDALAGHDSLRVEGESVAARLREEGEATIARLRDEFEARAAEAREAAEAALAAARTEVQTAASLHSHAIDAHQTGALRLLEAIRALDGASSLTEVLDALTTGAAGEAGRAAMLVVKGERLVGWRTVGFGAFDQDARGIETSTGDVGALAAAVNTGRPAVVGTGSVLAAPGFAEAPADRPGLAVPLLVGGKAVAVVYADPGAESPAAGWTSPVEVLVRHAARCLEGLAVQRATARPAPARVGAPA